MNPLFPVEYIVIFAMTVIVAGGYLSWRSSAIVANKTRVLITGSRIAALLALTMIAFDFGDWKAETDKNIAEWGIVLDYSQSMNVKDVSGKSRFSAGKALTKQLLTELDNVKVYPFAGNVKYEQSRLRRNSTSNSEHRMKGKYNFLSSQGNSVKALDKLVADGSSTDITGAGIEVMQKYNASATKLKGLVIISDGREVKSKSSIDFPLLARAANIPIYAVPLGGQVKGHDLALETINRHYTEFAGQSQTVAVKVKNSNMGRIKTKVEIVNTTGQVLAEQELFIEDNSTQTVHLTLHLKRPGLHELFFKIPLIEKDKKQNNNSVGITVSVINEKLNVLLIEGLPFWDSKFLSQVLRQNANINFSAIYRLTPERFFKIDEKGQRSAESNAVIFPEKMENLSKFNLIIFGKGAEFFLNEQRVNLLKRYVRDYGGAILFARGKPYSGTLKILNPLEPVKWGEELNRRIRWYPAPAGISSGLFGEMLPGVDNQLWQALAPIERAYRCPTLKSFSEVMVIGKNESGKGASIPVLINRKFGKGIIVAVNSEGLWKWDFSAQKQQKNGQLDRVKLMKDSSKRSKNSSGNAINKANFYRRFWTQLVYWSIKYSDFLPNQDYSLHLSKSVIMPGENVAVLVNSRITQADDFNLTLEISSNELSEKSTAASKGFHRAIVPSRSLSGNSWNALFALPRPGTYTIKIKLPNRQKCELFAVLHVKQPPEENDNLSADSEYLKSIVESAGGQLIQPDKIIAELDAANQLKKTTETVQKQWQSSWNRWWLLTAILLFLSIEIYLRRRNGML